MTVVRRDPGAAAGIAFLLEFIAGLALSVTQTATAYPMPDAPAAEIQRFFTDVMKLQAVWQLASAVLLVVFTGSLAALLRRTGSATAASIAAGAGVAAAAFLALSALTIGVVAADRPGGDAAFLAHELIFVTGGTGHVVWLGVLGAAVALPSLRNRILPRWLAVALLAWSALAVLSPLSRAVGPAVALVPIGRFTVMLVLAAVAVRMLIGHTRTRTPEPPSRVDR